MKKFFSNIFKGESKSSPNLGLDDWVMIPKETPIKKRKVVPKQFDLIVKDYVLDKYEHENYNHSPGSENLLHTFENALKPDVINLSLVKQIIWDSGCHEKYRPLVWKILIGYIPRIQYVHPPVFRERKIHYERFKNSLKSQRDNETYDILQLIRSAMSSTSFKTTLFRNTQLANLLESVLHCLFVQYKKTLYNNDSLVFVVSIVTYAFLQEHGYNGGLFLEKDLPQEELLILEADVYNASSIFIFQQLEDLYFGSLKKDIPAKVEEYLKEYDMNLYEHLSTYEVGIDTFIFIWIDSYLLNLLQNLEYVVRIWDICLCSGNFIGTYALFCTFILTAFSSDLKKLKDTEEIHEFALNIPLHKWSESKIESLMAKVKEKAEMVGLYQKYTNEEIES